MPFTLPTKMFLSCLLDVTHISAKTPHLSQAQARIIARSSLKQYFHALGPAKAAAFPALHTGSGNTGCFSGKGKVSGWKTFIQTEEEEVLSGFLALGVSAIPSIETLPLIETFVCQLGILSLPCYLWGLWALHCIVDICK